MLELTEQEKYLLRKYAGFSNKELVNLVREKSILYSRLIDSENIARKVLANHGRFFHKRNEAFKYNYLKLLKGAALRGVNTDKIVKEYNATLEDIISRIEENRYKEASIIDEYCYKYDGYCGAGNWNLPNFHYEEGQIGADIMTAEVSELYDQIVEEVTEKYSDRKVLVKIKK